MEEELTQENDIEGRRKEYLVQLLNGDEISAVGGDERRERIGENARVVRVVMREEIMGALEDKVVKKLVWIALVEMLKNGGISITN